MDEEEIAAIRRLLTAHTRRLRKLQERQAEIGRNRQPDLDIEIEDIEKIVEQLKQQLNEPQMKAGLY